MDSSTSVDLHRIDRVRVEHSIGRLEGYERLADLYDRTIGRFNYKFNVITGLVWQLLQAGQEALRHERHRDAVEEDLRHVPGARQRLRVEGVDKGGDREDAQEHARPNGAGPGAGAGKLGRALGRP